MILSLIVAMAENRVIGRDNQLPWHLPDDLKFFKKHTLGKPVIMGRKTFESIGKPLPNRPNIVISGNPEFQADGCKTTTSLEQALTHCAGEDEIMIIGGARLFADTLPDANRLYLTLVHASVKGDVLFPEFDWNEWVETDREEHAADERHEFSFSLVCLERREKSVSGASD